jgi:hypothetical protein
MNQQSKPGWIGPMRVKDALEITGRQSATFYKAIKHGYRCGGYYIDSHKVGGERIVWLRKAEDLSSVDVTTLRALMDYMSEYMVAPRTADLAREQGWEYYHAHRSIHRLEEAGYVVCIEHAWQPLKNEHGQSVTPILTWEVEDAT